MHAGYVEENLLSQIRSVYANQIMCVWIHGKTLVRLAVGEINPSNADYVKLTNQTEVIVAPKVRRPNTKPQEEELKPVEQKKTHPSVALRVTSLSSVDVDPLSIQVHPDSLTAFVDKIPDVVRLTKLIPNFINTKKKDEDQNSPTLGDLDEPIHPNSVFSKLVVSTQVPIDHVLVGTALASTLNINLFDIVKVSTTSVKKTTLGSVILRRCTSPAAAPLIKLGLDQVQQQQQKLNAEQEMTQLFKAWLSSQCKPEIILSQGLLVELDEHHSFVVQLGQKKGFFSSMADEPATGAEHYTTVEQVEKLSVEFGEDISKPPTMKKKEKEDVPLVLGGVDKLYTKIEQYTLANLSNRALKSVLGVPGSGGVLVSGSHGSGKTSLVKKLLNSVKSFHICKCVLCFI